MKKTKGGGLIGDGCSQNILFDIIFLPRVRIPVISGECVSSECAAEHEFVVRISTVTRHNFRKSERVGNSHSHDSRLTKSTVAKLLSRPSRQFVTNTHDRYTNSRSTLKIIGST